MKNGSRSTTTPSIVNLDALRNIDLNLLLNDTIIDCMYVAGQLSAYSKSEDNSETKAAAELLTAIAYIHDRFENSSNPYGPMSQSNKGRSLIPSDLVGEQSNQLYAFLPTVKSRSLKARIADLVWINDKKNKDAADVAISTYLDLVESYLDGNAKFSYGASKSLDFRILDLLRRCFQISRAIKGKSGGFPIGLIENVLRIKADALSSNDIAISTRIITLMLDYDVGDSLEIAKEMEIIFENRTKIDPHWDKFFLEVLRSIYRKNNLAEQERSCQMKIAECSIARAKSMDSSPMGAAHWLMVAIDEMRKAGGAEAKERIGNLRQKLREKQEDTVFEMIPSSIPIETKILIENTMETFRGLDLSMALKEFALLHKHQSPDFVKKQAKDGMKSFIFDLVDTTHLDQEGKTIARTPSRNSNRDHSDKAVMGEVSKNAEVKRLLVVNSAILPAKHYIWYELSPRKECFDVICQSSPFIPHSHKEIFSRGFWEFFSGDMLIACSLLIPQMENSLRHILTVSGKDPSSLEGDLTQEYRSISRLLVTDRNDLEKLLGKELVFEIDLVFNILPGPRLRHEMAHGKLGLGGYYTNAAIYGVWLMYQITCLPIFDHWKKLNIQR